MFAGGVKGILPASALDRYSAIAAPRADVAGPEQHLVSAGDHHPAAMP